MPNPHSARRPWPSPPAKDTPTPRACCCATAPPFDAIDSRGWTPLHTAAAPWWQENAELANLLIAAGADLHARNNEGRTPLDLAKAAGHAQTVALFAGA